MTCPLPTRLRKSEDFFPIRSNQRDRWRQRATSGSKMGLSLPVIAKNTFGFLAADGNGADG